MNHNSLSRRDFLKLSGLGLGALALNPFRNAPSLPAKLPQFPAGDRLGRIVVTPNYYSTELKPSPNVNVPAIRNVAQDEVVVWQREVVGTEAYSGTSTRWVETPEGFIYAPYVQPVRNLPNTPIASLPAGKQGFWAEVTVPYVDLRLPQGAVPIGEGVKYNLETGQPIRLYYSQVVWIDQVGADANGNILYRFNEAPQHGYGPGDVFYADGAAFRPLTDEDVAPINPDVDPAAKKIVIDATSTRQYLSCFEGNTEVYFCRVSTGFAERFATPLGDQAIAWKIFSLHMAANTGAGSGYDTMAVSWPTFFNTNAGAAVHATFWHNDFGVRRSHGCVNVLPEDAQWIFRWTSPFVSLDQSELRLQWPNVGGPYSTSVVVNETMV
ncbi:MAG: L,D-transpeptidase [Chloroflexi bacterium]|nr:L,D-transpeptidase [Chloroflexota bacterium]